MKKIIALAAACAMACAATLAPAAQAQERNLVAFGDSILADPDIPSYLKSRFLPGGNSGRDCPKGNNYARQAGAQLGLAVHDYSCSGAVTFSPGPQIFAQVDHALEQGTLNASTARVIYTVGFNDTYNNRGMTPDQLRASFVAANAPQINRIRAAAPNARIQIVGYPSIGLGDRYCLVHIGENPLDYTKMPSVRSWEDSAQWMQIDLARATGVEFLDLKPATQHNTMCAGAQDRYFAGLIDFSSGPRNLPVHLNARGQEAVARLVSGS